MITLTRIDGGPSQPDGTFGRWVVPIYNGLYDPETPNVRGELVSAEDDWLGNRRGVSCIPAGIYTLRRVFTPKHGEVFQVMDVPGRLGILVHPGNTEEDTEGCILLGLRFGPLPVLDEDSKTHREVRKKAALSSKVAFGKWMAWMAETDEAPLTIRWAPGLVDVA